MDPRLLTRLILNLLAYLPQHTSLTMKTFKIMPCLLGCLCVFLLFFPWPHPPISHHAPSPLVRVPPHLLLDFSVVCEEYTCVPVDVEVYECVCIYIRMYTHICMSMYIS